MDFKVRCFACSEKYLDLFTIGKIYEVNNGTIECDDGFKFSSWSNNGDTFKNLNSWFEYYNVMFEEVEEANGMKFKIGDKVKVTDVKYGICNRKTYIGQIFTIDSYNPNGENAHMPNHYGVKESMFIYYEDELELYDDHLERIKETLAKFKGVSDMKNLVTVKNVIFNPPATIIHWSDNTKSVVKCQGDEQYDAEKGFVMAYLKKLLGNDNTFNKEITKWVTYEPPVEKVEKVVEVTKDWKLEDYLVSEFTYKFRVGDKVKVAGSADTFTTYIDGKIGTITGMFNNGGYKYFVKCDDGLTWGVKEDQLTLVEPTNKFKVGDKVRGHGSAADFNDGLDDKVGTIVRINTDRRLKYCIEYEPYFYLNFAEDQLELVKEEPIEPIEPKPVKKDRYEPGDKVKIIDHRGKFWNHEGKMDEYCGKVLTVKTRSGWSDSIYTMEECPRWVFDYYDIVGVVEDAPKEEPKSKYYNGKVVCVESPYSWWTVGKVYDVVDGIITDNNRCKYPHPNRGEPYKNAEDVKHAGHGNGGDRHNHRNTFIPIKE